VDDLKEVSFKAKGSVFCFFPVPGHQYDVEEYFLEDILKR